MRLAHRLRTSLWMIPLACALLGIGLAFATLAVDRAFPDAPISRQFTGDPNAALIILSTIAASMVSLTALVLTITSVVVQLAMGQFSPRSVRPFLQDRPSQLAIGVFVGTFAHAMLSMRAVQSFGHPGDVPGLTIVVSYTLVIVDIVVLVAYVHHIANSLKVDSIIRSIGTETRGLIDKLFPEPDDRIVDLVDRDGVIAAEEAGTVYHIEHEALVELAEQADVHLEMTVGTGMFIPEGAPMFRYGGDGHRVDERSARRAVAIGPERTMDQDAAFGIQTLVDIAERALSESFNDQTTASQVVDRLHDILRQLSTRRIPQGTFEGSDGSVRLTVPTLTWDGYVGLAFDDLTLAAAASPSVIRRIELALEDLAAIVPRPRRAAILARLDASRAEAAPTRDRAQR
jgi:uncharacterized membrane protein